MFLKRIYERLVLCALPWLLFEYSGVYYIRLWNFNLSVMFLCCQTVCVCVCVCARLCIWECI